MSKLSFVFGDKFLQVTGTVAWYRIYGSKEEGVFDVFVDGEAAYFGSLDECVAYCNEREYGKPKTTTFEAKLLEVHESMPDLVPLSQPKKNKKQPHPAADESKDGATRES